MQQEEIGPTEGQKPLPPVSRVRHSTPQTSLEVPPLQELLDESNRRLHIIPRGGGVAYKVALTINHDRAREEGVGLSDVHRNTRLAQHDGILRAWAV